jgi:hypothetical protein
MHIASVVSASLRRGPVRFAIGVPPRRNSCHRPRAPGRAVRARGHHCCVTSGSTIGYVGVASGRLRARMTPGHEIRREFSVSREASHFGDEVLQPSSEVVLDPQPRQLFQFPSVHVVSILSKWMRRSERPPGVGTANTCQPPRVLARTASPAAPTPASSGCVGRRLRRRGSPRRSAGASNSARVAVEGREMSPSPLGVVRALAVHPRNLSMCSASPAALTAGSVIQVRRGSLSSSSTSATVIGAERP